MLGILLGLGSSVCWGISDFLGGIQSRRFSALAVLVVSQPVGLAFALGIALAAGGEIPADQFAVAAAGGAAALLALGAFYRAMALGSISVVATIGALGVMVPVAVGLARGEEPGDLQAAGAVLALGGVVMVAREPDPEWRAASRRSVGLAAVAALGFGTFFVALDSAAGHDPAWTIVAARVGGVLTVIAAALAFRPALPREVGALPVLVVIGLFDVLANTLFAIATNHGLLSLVSVAGSMYAAVTVLLARAFLAERLAHSQRTGVLVALGGVAMIAAGV